MLEAQSDWCKERATTTTKPAQGSWDVLGPPCQGFSQRTWAVLLPTRGVAHKPLIHRPENRVLAVGGSVWKGCSWWHIFSHCAPTLRCSGV